MTVESPAVDLMVRDRRKRDDPLAHFTCSSEGQELAAEYFAAGVETYVHAAERAGKSRIGLACSLALCQGQPGLKRRDESLIPFPRLQTPVQGVLALDTYKLGGAGVIRTLWSLLGEWPHERGPMASSGCPSYVDIFHRDARSREDWSRLWIFPYDGVLPRSMELDFWHCDEPPPIAFVEALTSRVGAIRHAPRGIITATPLDEITWGPIKARYPENEREVVDGRVRVRWSVFDNQALPESAKHALRVAAKGSAYELAKLYGHHVNAKGGNPWSAEGLGHLMSMTRPPLLTERLIVQAETLTEDGKKLLEVAAPLLVWEQPIRNDPYYIVGDPAKGITDGLHDPDGLQVWNRRKKSLVAELDGYLGGWGLGNAMAKLAKRYNNAICDPLTTGGYGEAVLSSLRESRYTNLTHDRVERRPGAWEQTVGTVETHELRGKIVGAVERAIQTGQCDIPSASVIACWQGCIVDKQGKIVAGPRGHDEKLICSGRALVYMGQWAAPKPRAEAPKKYENPVLAIRRRIEKRDEEIALRFAPKIGPRHRGRSNGNGVAHIEP